MDETYDNIVPGEFYNISTGDTTTVYKCTAKSNDNIRKGTPNGEIPYDGLLVFYNDEAGRILLVLYKKQSNTFHDNIDETIEYKIVKKEAGGSKQKRTRKRKRQQKSKRQKRRRYSTRVV